MADLPVPISTAEFVGWVDEYLSGPMHRLGYNRIGAYPEEDGSISVGFEAADGAARRRVNPEHPPTADELWITYHADDGELDLSPWWDILGDHADWDLADDQAPGSKDEVRRRITVVGRAVQQLL